MAKTTYTASDLDKYTIAQLEVAAKKYDDMIKEADENGDLAKKQIFATRQARIIKQQYAIKRMHAKLSQKFPSIKDANVRTISILTMKKTAGKEIVQGNKNKTGYGFGGLMNDLKGVGLGVSTGLIAYGTANSILIATTGGKSVFDNIGSLVTKLAGIGGAGYNIAGAATILAGAGAIAAVGISCLVAKKVRQIQANRIAAMRASLEEDKALAETEKDMRLKEAHPEQDYNDALISNDSLRQSRVNEIARDPKKMEELKDLLNMQDLSPEQKSAISTIVSLAQLEAANLERSRASKTVFASLLSTPEAEAFKEAQKKKTDLITGKADLAAANATISAVSAIIASGYKESDYQTAKNNYDTAYTAASAHYTGDAAAIKTAIDNDLAGFNTNTRELYAVVGADPAKRAEVARLIVTIDNEYDAAIQAEAPSNASLAALQSAVSSDSVYLSDSDVRSEVDAYINTIATNAPASKDKELRLLESRKKILDPLELKHTQVAQLPAAQAKRDSTISKYHPDYATLKTAAATASTSSAHAAAKTAMETAITALDTTNTPPTLDGGQTEYDNRIGAIDTALDDVASIVSKEDFDKMIASMETLTFIGVDDTSRTVDVLKHWANEFGVPYNILQGDSTIKALAEEFAKNHDLVPAFNAIRKFEKLDAPIAALADVESGKFFDTELSNATNESANAYTDAITAACNSVDQSIKDPARAQAMKNKIQAMTPAQLEAFLQKGLDMGAAELGA